MPELPEVELAARRLRASLLGRQIAGVRQVDPKLAPGPASAALAAALTGQAVETVERRAKYLLLRLTSGPTLLVHLRMTGRFELASSGEPEELRHPVRFGFNLGEVGWVLFRDPRRFGRFELLDPGAVASHRALVALGPDALEDPLDAAGLAELARGRRQSIKALLMDQRRIGGLGNIYAGEVLYRAGVSPSRPAGMLADEEFARIAAAIPATLRWAIDRQSRGELIYLGERGAENGFTVYRRRGQACPRCGSVIQRSVVAGRGTFHCPGCQPG